MIRQRALFRLGKLAEPLAWGALGALGLGLAIRSGGAGGWISALIGLGIAAFGALGLAAWARRARLEPGGEAAGIVAVTEARLGYFSAEGGGFADLGALQRIDIETGPAGAVWVLREEGAPPTKVPAAARGAERLTDAVAALPGADLATAQRALQERRPAQFTIWRKAEATAQTPLAPPGRRH